MSITIWQLAVGGFDHNFSYLAVDAKGEALLVDPTGDAEVIRQAVETAGEITARYILLTHGHRDHTQAVEEALRFFPAEVIAHPEHPLAGQIHLADGQLLPFGGIAIEAIFTPGHSLDSVCYRFTDNSALFTGDVLFVGCIGFGRPSEMYNSLMKKIFPLSDTLLVYSGHDYGPVAFRSLGEEKKLNPYLNCESLNEFKSMLKHLK